MLISTVNSRVISGPSCRLLAGRTMGPFVALFQPEFRRWALLRLCHFARWDGSSDSPRPEPSIQHLLDRPLARVGRVDRASPVSATASSAASRKPKQAPSAAEASSSGCRRGDQRGGSAGRGCSPPSWVRACPADIAISTDATGGRSSS